jgi:hypothetical protein
LYIAIMACVKIQEWQRRAGQDVRANEWVVLLGWQDMHTGQVEDLAPGLTSPSCPWPYLAHPCEGVRSSHQWQQDGAGVLIVQHLGLTGPRGGGGLTPHSRVAHSDGDRT